MKIAYVTTDWVKGDGSGPKDGEDDKLYGGVGYYRAIKPAEYLRERGHHVDVFGKNFKDHTEGKTLLDGYIKWSKNYDVVVIKQVDNRHISQLIGACHQNGVPIVMDLDDNFLEVFEDQPALENGYDRGGIQKGYAAAAMSMMDALFVSCENLKRDLADHLKKGLGIDMPIYVLPNCNDVNDWEYNINGSDKFVIGWHGSITHDKDLQLVLPTVQEVMKENDNVYLFLMGGIRQESVVKLFGGWEKEMFERIMVIGGTQTWQGFPELLMQMPFDIGLAPLVDNKFNRSKSHIKWMEYAMRKTPTVASNVEPYKVIRHKVDGFLCDSPDDFKKWLTKLVKDEKLREEIGQNAYNEVVEHWQYKDNIHLWEEAFKSVSKRQENSAKSLSQARKEVERR